MSGPRMLATATAVLAVALVAACTGDDPEVAPPQPVQETSTTAVVDRSGIVLGPVDGVTTTIVEERGTAIVAGTVRGPAGPIAGASVRIERLVGEQPVSTDVLTAADGTFELAEVPGGRYRVRAFLAPTLAQTTAEVRFLADGERHGFDLVVEDQRGVVVRADIAPDAPTLGAPVNLVLQVSSRTVDADGVVRSQPITGRQVELAGLGRWQLRDDRASRGSTSSTISEPAATAALAITDGGGRVRFELLCRAAGPPGLSLRVPVVVAAPVPPPTGEPTGTTTVATAPLITTETVLLDLVGCAAAEAPSSTTVGVTDGEATSTTGTAP